MRDQSTLPTTGTCLWRYRVRKEIGQIEASQSRIQKAFIFGPRAAPYRDPVEFLQRTHRRNVGFREDKQVQQESSINGSLEAPRSIPR